MRIAARRFAEQGFEATTIREIARDAKILSGSLYYHFATKEEMLHEIIRNAAEAMQSQTLKVAHAMADAEAKIAALTLLSFNELFEDQDAFAILYNERQFFRHSKAFEYVSHAKAKLYQSWRISLEQGLHEQTFRPNLDTFMTITTVIRMINTCADWYRHGADHDPSMPLPEKQQVVDFNIDFIFRSIRVGSRLDLKIPRAAADRLLEEFSAQSGTSYA